MCTPSPAPSPPCSPAQRITPSLRISASDLSTPALMSRHRALGGYWSTSCSTPMRGRRGARTVRERDAVHGFSLAVAPAREHDCEHQQRGRRDVPKAPPAPHGAVDRAGQAHMLFAHRCAVAAKLAAGQLVDWGMHDRQQGEAHVATRRGRLKLAPVRHRQACELRSAPLTRPSESVVQAAHRMCPPMRSSEA